MQAGLPRWGAPLAEGLQPLTHPLLAATQLVPRRFVPTELGWDPKKLAVWLQMRLLKSGVKGLLLLDLVGGRGCKAGRDGLQRRGMQQV